MDDRAYWSPPSSYSSTGAGLSSWRTAVLSSLEDFSCELGLALRATDLSDLDLALRACRLFLRQLWLEAASGGLHHPFGRDMDRRLNAQHHFHIIQYHERCGRIHRDTVACHGRFNSFAPFSSAACRHPHQIHPTRTEEARQELCTTCKAARWALDSVERR
ncbi:hypothetical protein K523DRAFT_29236 [Schizophyllum commune Tattone D]|nr:hypothetical protein K523DRAFT_29236 [Schizophyllum commune Tattone D]